MRIGVVVMPVDPWPETRAVGQRLDGLGYDHLWVYDHLSWRRYRDHPWHATYPLLTGLAVATDRIAVGTLVSNLNIRHPVTLAKDAMTIDHMSNGRLIIGVGAAGLGYDATVLGQAPLTPGQRVDRLAEFVGVFDGLLAGTLTDHQGSWYTVVGAQMLPGCVQQPRVRLAVAAGGPKSIAIAAQHGQTWVTFGDTSRADSTAAQTEADVRRQGEQLDRACEAVDRDPASINRLFMIGNTAERPLRTIEAFHDFVGRYQAIGFTDIVFHYPRPDDPVLNDPVEIVDEIAAVYCSTTSQVA
jgi:alkanesulfonate monooxygenase SsuD/methylene tetrahydromethanopterin reductase-like flavin-dependent oxidoreductase (luciferase family)